MTAKRPFFVRKRFLRTSLVAVLFFVLLLAGLHIWFVNNARHVLKQIVAEKSNGKFRLELSGLQFNFFNRKLQVNEAAIMSTDSTSAPSTYNIRFRKLTLRIHSFWPMIFKNQLRLDSIRLYDPEIEVMQWRRDTSARNTDDELSVPQEMGKLYNSMLDGLETVGIRRIVIENARLKLVNRMETSQKPVVISNIYFDLLRSADPRIRRDTFVENKQNIHLYTYNQDVNLPGGRHHISFKNFSLQLFKKRIELDSCTFTGFTKDSSGSSYSVFFNKLYLIGVDFDALYRSSLIRADSVYCERPFFDISLNTSVQARDVSRKKSRPDLDKIVRELVGNMDLGFVGVREAGMKINITGSKKRSVLNSGKDNFEMRGFRIDADSAKPISVSRFDMLARDYQLYNADSSASYSFDSIRFFNNRIVLSNFEVVTGRGRDATQNKRDFRIPYFELAGLDWYQLIFEENLQAKEAVLYNPVMNFKRGTKKRVKKKFNLFHSLHTLDSLMSLTKVKILNGQLNMELGPQSSLQLSDLNLSLNSNTLMQSSENNDLQEAVEFLSFSKGLIRIKEMTAALGNISLSGNNLVHADRLSLFNRSKTVRADINDVYIDNPRVNDEAETILLDGLRWSNATLDITTGASKKEKNEPGLINIKNISGSNTRLRFKNGKTAISTYLQQLRLSSLEMASNKLPQLQGLEARGKDLSLASGAMKIDVDSYDMQGDEASQLAGINLEKHGPNDSLVVRIQQLVFSSDINNIIAGNYHFGNVQLTSPEIWQRRRQGPSPGAGSFNLSIDRLSLTEPSIDLATYRNDSVTLVQLPRSRDARLAASGISMGREGTRIGHIQLSAPAARFTAASGQTYEVKKGRVELDASNIILSSSGTQRSWSAVVNSILLDDQENLGLGNTGNRLSLKQLSAGNLHLSSDQAGNVSRLIRANLSAWLKTSNGEYRDSNTVLKWYNASYNAAARNFILDSFSYQPAKPRDTVMKYALFQQDYISFQSGSVVITGFDLERYERDSLLQATSAVINHPQISIYRDKKPPFQKGAEKPLPVDLIRRIIFPVAIDQVVIRDGGLSYTEKNAKTRLDGTLQIKRLNGVISNIRNRNLKETDSLALAVTAYLMDSAFIDLRVKESYTDSLNSFAMTLRMRPTTLSFLNPVIAPLSNVQITSGTIDSFQLRAIGRKDMALGEMKLYYHGLKIRLIKGGSPDSTSFSRKVASFLVNSFVLRRNNNGRPGIVYFERMRDRSFFHYIVRMTFSGLATSTGVRNNKKYLRQYKRGLNERNLPEVRFD
ncbi:MAG TPA: hypothetical protein VFR58_02530 [Flavisolibacter sp.]|nr:hypothetical protein [Flavisolibacter sp.]